MRLVYHVRGETIWACRQTRETDRFTIEGFDTKPGEESTASVSKPPRVYGNLSPDTSVAPILVLPLLSHDNPPPPPLPPVPQRPFEHVTLPLEALYCFPHAPQKEVGRDELFAWPPHPPAVRPRNQV